MKTFFVTLLVIIAAIFIILSRNTLERAVCKRIALIPNTICIINDLRAYEDNLYTDDEILDIIYENDTRRFWRNLNKYGELCFKEAKYSNAIGNLFRSYDNEKEVYYNKDVRDESGALVNRLLFTDETGISGNKSIAMIGHETDFSQLIKDYLSYICFDAPHLILYRINILIKEMNYDFYKKIERMENNKKIERMEEAREKEKKIREDIITNLWEKYLENKE